MEDIIQKLKEDNPYNTDYQRAHSLIKEMNNARLSMVILFFISIFIYSISETPTIFLFFILISCFVWWSSGDKRSEIKILREKVSSFEHSLYVDFSNKIKSLYIDRLYRKRSVGEDFKLAIIEFNDLLQSLTEANKILITETFELDFYRQYLRKRQYPVHSTSSRRNPLNLALRPDQSLGEFEQSSMRMNGVSKLSNTREVIVGDTVNVDSKSIKDSASTDRQNALPEIYFSAPKRPRVIDWDRLNKIKSEIGKAGEALAVYTEVKYLQEAGRSDLAEKVRHVAKEGDGFGYDILSYSLDEKERYIEVKSTTQDIDTPFNMSANEISFLKSNLLRSFIYRIKLPDSNESTEMSYMLVRSARDVLKNAEIIPTQYVVKIPFDSNVKIVPLPGNS